MPTISSTSPATALDGALEAAWNSAQTQNTQPNDLPEELAVEAKNNYGDINVRPFFAKLAIDQEKLRDGKIGMKNQELEALRDKLKKITNFLDVANHELMRTNGDTINLAENAGLLFEVKAMLPENAANLIGNKSVFKRKEVEYLCQMFTRRIDGEIMPQIDEIKDDIFDIMQLLDKILPILKELGKKYDDHISYIQRQPK